MLASLKSCRLVAVACSLALLSCGCASFSQFSKMEPAGSEDILRVGITPNAPPYAYKAGRRITGLEADMASELGKELNKRIKFVEVSWLDQIPALLDARTDIIMSGMSATKTKEVRVKFSEPYLRTGQMALVLRDDLLKYITRGSVILTRGKVGVEKGAMGEHFVQRDFPDATISSYRSAEAAVKALIDRKVDLVIHDAPVAWWLASQYEAKGVAVVEIMLMEEHLAWAVRNEEDRLLSAVNAALATMMRDGRWSKIVKRWLPYAKTE